MRVNTFFTPVFRLISLACVTSVLTTLTAFDFYPHAFELHNTCHKTTVAQWQVQMADRDPFTEAEAALNETEAFIRACPNRPEVPLAQALAGVLATRIGDPDRALAHFAAAPSSAPLHAKFAQISSLLATGQTDAAWALRDAVIAHWQNDLAARGMAAIVSHPKRGGTLLEILFHDPQPQTGINVVWLAVPTGPGWPAAISAGSKRDLSRIRLIADQPDAAAIQFVDFYRCRSRRLLGPGQVRTDFDGLRRQTELLLTTYLRAPDSFLESAPGQPLKGCFWPDRLLPGAAD